MHIWYDPVLSSTCPNIAHHPVRFPYDYKFTHFGCETRHAYLVTLPGLFQGPLQLLLL